MELVHVHGLLPKDAVWVVAGDFNCSLDSGEKKGGLPYPIMKTLAFHSCFSDCGLMDAGFCGSNFTWCNGRHRD